MAIITLTTDFGPASRYVAQMKGVLYCRAPGVTLVDLSHEIPPQDVAAAARLLEQSAPWYPEGTVHLAIVDPGVGTDRDIVAVELEGQRFVGPDNGLFGWAEVLSEGIVRLDLERFHAETASMTFHGRDLMAPAAAKLALGAALSDLGPPQDELVQLPPAPGPTRTENRIEGRVVEIDRYGNVITNVRQALLGDAPLDDRLRITLGEHETLGLWRTYAEQAPQTLIALVGSDGFVELAIVNGNAAQMLGASPGDTVVLDWESAED